MRLKVPELDKGWASAFWLQSRRPSLCPTLSDLSFSCVSRFMSPQIFLEGSVIPIVFLILRELRKNRSEEGLQREICEVIKTIVQRRAGKRNRKGRRMAEMYEPKEPDDSGEAGPPVWGDGGDDRAPGS